MTTQEFYGNTYGFATEDEVDEILCQEEDMKLTTYVAGATWNLDRDVDDLSDAEVVPMEKGIKNPYASIQMDFRLKKTS